MAGRRTVAKVSWYVGTGQGGVGGAPGRTLVLGGAGGVGDTVVPEWEDTRVARVWTRVCGAGWDDNLFFLTG